MGELKTFYFTFGTDEEFPFRGGWVEVEAPEYVAACAIFKAYFPNRERSGCINCSSIYSEEQFKKTSMYEEGNLGAGCHCIIGPHK